MAGPRQRCAYCSDSHASDIDHFKPIAVDHGSTFKWPNLLWVCTRCNRKKGKRFPATASGDPLLIDPSITDPWRHMTLDTASGFIAPRYIVDKYDIFGEATLEVLPTINNEAVAEGRARTCKRLRSAVNSVNEEPTPEAISELLSEVSQDDVGVSRWYGYWEGAAEAELLLLKQTRRNIWKRFLRACA
ncbi:HNH endonuclease [Mycobacterium sp. 2-64]|uniref:HNH endonuclease n=1 Tax=Mycobacterium sp. 2-64 TaxID=3042319 RepID=UPI003FA38CC1